MVILGGDQTQNRKDIEKNNTTKTKQTPLSMQDVWHCSFTCRYLVRYNKWKHERKIRVCSIKLVVLNYMPRILTFSYRYMEGSRKGIWNEKVGHNYSFFFSLSLAVRSCWLVFVLFQYVRQNSCHFSTKKEMDIIFLRIVRSNEWYEVSVKCFQFLTFNLRLWLLLIL